MPEVDERDRPDFVKGHVVTVSRDGHVFWVQTPHESACLKVDQKQQAERFLKNPKQHSDTATAVSSGGRARSGDPLARAARAWSQEPALH